MNKWYIKRTKINCDVKFGRKCRCKICFQICDYFWFNVIRLHCHFSVVVHCKLHDDTAIPVNQRLTKKACGFKVFLKVSVIAMCIINNLKWCLLYCLFMEFWMYNLEWNMNTAVDNYSRLLHLHQLIFVTSISLSQ